MRVIKQTTTEELDCSTGEISKQTSTKVVQFPKEPPYIKMYIRDLCDLIGVEDADQALLRLLLMRLDYDGYVALSPRSREAMAKQLGIVEKTLRNRMTRLVKADLIRHVSRGEYQVNPRYFARGAWKEVCEQRQAYELKVTYSDTGGRKVSSSPIEGDAHLQQGLEL